MSHKICPKCLQEKPIDSFGVRIKTERNGKKMMRLVPRCKECERTDARERARIKRQSPEGLLRLRENQYRYRQKVGGRKAERDRYKVTFEGQQMTRGEMLAIKQQRKEQREAQAQAERVERKKALEARRAERIALKPWTDYSLSAAEQFKLRYQLDEEFNIKQRLRAAMRRKRQGASMGDLIRGALNRGGRSIKFEDFAGYTTKELRDHLERQFTKGMSWQKFRDGDIHIDHIVPLSSFDLHDPEELRRAWAITNLRPLWAKDNLQKSAKCLFLV